MNSSCITELGVKPECKDKLQNLIKALKECNEESSLVPEEEVIQKPGESISDIFNNLRKTLCGSQECHGVKKVSVSTIDADELNKLYNSHAYDKFGYFLASKSGDVVDIKLYVDHEKDSQALNFGSQTFVNSSCNYVPSDFNMDYEYGPYCAKAAQVMLFLTQRHSDNLAYFFEDLARLGCENGDKIIQELDNYYNSEFQTWLTGQQLI